MKTIVHLVLFFSSLSCLGQELYHRTLNSDNGLPSNKVHWVYEDSKGYVWFGTENGACRWDSKNFVYYTIKDGLPNNEVLVIYEDSKGRIWFSTFSNELCYLYHDTIYNKKNDKKLEKIIIDKGVPMKEYMGKLYAAAPNKKHCNLKINIDSIEKIDTVISIGGKSSFFSINGELISYLNSSPDINQGYHSSSLIFRDTLYNFFEWYIDFLDSSFFKITDFQNKKYYLVKQKDFFYFVGRYSRYKKSLAESLSSPQYPSINEFFEWFKEKGKPYPIISADEKSIVYESKFKGKMKFFDYFKGRIVSFYENMVMNQEQPLFSFSANFFNGFGLQDNYYVQTKNDIEYFSDFIVYHFKTNTMDNSIHKIYKWKGDIRLIDENGLEYNLTNRTINYLKINSKLYNLSLGESNRPILTSSKSIVDVLSGKELTTSYNDILAFFKGFSYSPKHKLYTINNSQQGLFLQDLNKKARKISDLYAYTSFIDSRDRLWVGTTNKLYVAQQFLPQVKGEKEVKLNPKLDIFCSEIKEDHKGNLFFTTNDGIYVLDKQDRTYHVSDQNFLSSNECVTLKLDTQTQNFIVATKNGVNQIHYETQKGSLTFRVVNKFFKEDGLSSNEIKDILIDGDSLWVATAKGLDLINDKSSHPDTLKIPIHINKVYVNDSLWTLDSTYRLDYTQNNLKIDYSAIYYQRRDRLDIRYRLIKDGDTTNGKLNDNLLNLFSLASGDYILQLYAYDRDYPYIRSDYRTLKFTISPPYYKTWWFYSLILLGSLSLLGGFLWYRNKIKLEKLQAESELHRLTLHGLQNQMNPHFVFNALNTLQHFIVKKDNLNSLNFLSDFSTLIRKILDNSRSLFISLEEEITFLKQYTQIEGERYGNRFRIDFEIEIEEDELTDIRIPPMLIQPLIENAIKHGVSSMEEGGEIQIRFRLEEEDVLKVEVIDNGAGIKDMGKKTSSKAITILRERLALIKDKSRKGEYILERQGDKTHSILYIPI